jgi:hypothetical protein
MVMMIMMMVMIIMMMKKMMMMKNVIKIIVIMMTMMIIMIYTSTNSIRRFGQGITTEGSIGSEKVAVKFFDEIAFALCTLLISDYIILI